MSCERDDRYLITGRKFRRQGSRREFHIRKRMEFAGTGIQNKREVRGFGGSVKVFELLKLSIGGE
jgi:hypothetical protein